MNLLATIIPGFRSLRTPVAAGLMWLSFAVILAASRNGHLHFDSATTDSLDKAFPDWFNTVGIPTVVAVSYVLGSVAVGITSVVTHRLGRATLRAVRWLADKVNPRHKTAWHLAYRIEKDDYASQHPYEKSRNRHHSQTLVNAGTPSESALIFPFDSSIETLALNAAQLSQTAPAQFQEYDRLKAESEFRVAIAPPLIALAVVVPLGLRPWMVIVAVIASATLLIQALVQGRRSNDVLANAAYLGFIKLVQPNSVAEYLRGLESAPEGDGQWIGAVISGLREMGLYGDSDNAIHELLEYEPRIRKAAVDYLKVHEKESADLFARLMREQRADIRKSAAAATNT
jgi:hypothetical protein